MVQVAADGQACPDCIVVIANADTSGITDLAEWESAVAAQNPTSNGQYHVVVACPDDCEGSFYHGTCDYCGRTFGTNFHPISFLH